MEEKDTRVSELLAAAKEIEKQLSEDGFSPEEMMFIATMLSHTASQLMKDAEGGDEDDEEENGGEEASLEPGEEPRAELVEDDSDYR